MYVDDFPLRLTQLRMKKGVSARDMSLSLGQNAGYINNIETGKALPEALGIVMFAEALPRDLSAHLKSLLEQQGLKRADVVRDADLDKAYVYQIFDGKKNPSRDKLIAITFGMHLNVEDTQRTLKLAGHSELYPRVARDAVILFAIQKGLDIWKTESLLYENGLPTLHPDE